MTILIFKNRIFSKWFFISVIVFLSSSVLLLKNIFQLEIILGFLFLSLFWEQYIIIFPEKMLGILDKTNSIKFLFKLSYMVVGISLITTFGICLLFKLPFRIAVLAILLTIFCALILSFLMIITANIIITKTKKSEDKLVSINNELTEKLNMINELRGILPICAYCKNIRDDKGFWHKLETYISKRSDVLLSKYICPECQAKP